MKKIIVVLMCFLLGMMSVVALEASISDYDPKPAEAGKFVNVWIKVENPTDNNEEDVYITAIPKDGLSLTSGEDAKQRVGILPPRGSGIVQYRLRVDDNAIEGPNVIDVELSNGPNNVNLKKAELLIEVTDKDFSEVVLSIGDVESDPTRIKPDDDDVKLEVTLQNLGDGKAQGVKAELIDLPKGITLAESYSGTSLLGNIEADGTATATFYIDVDEMTQPKEEQATLKLSYKYKPDEDEDDYLFEEELLDLSIAVRPIPLYNITLAELSPGSLRAGDEAVKLRLSIQNIGEEEGESVRIKVYGKTEQPFSLQTSTDFVAPSLKPGEIGQGTIEFDIDSDANLQTYYLDVEIKNVVGDDVLTYRKKVPVPVSFAEKKSPMGVIVLSIVVIVGIVATFIYRSRKTKKKPKSVKGSGGSYLDALDKKK